MAEGWHGSEDKTYKYLRKVEGKEASAPGLCAEVSSEGGR